MSTAKTKPSDPVNDAIAAVTAGASAEKTNEAPAAAAPAAKLTERSISDIKPTVAAPAVQAAPRPLRCIPITRNALQGTLHNYWDITAERGTIIEDVLHPDYFKHVAAQYRPHDEIVVICEDGSWRARLFVVNCDRLWAKVAVLEYKDLSTAGKDMPLTQEEEYEVTWDALNKFTLRKRTNPGLPPLKTGFQTRLEALNWLDGHLKTLNAK